MLFEVISLSRIQLVHCQQTAHPHCLLWLDADPKESEPAADDSSQMEDHPEDHIPTYADPRNIEREAAPETGDVYTLVDMSKKQVTVVMEENPYEPVEIEKTDVRSWTSTIIYRV